MIALEGREVRVRPVADIMAELQGETARLLAGPNASVDAFLAERRAEASREDADLGSGASSRHPSRDEGENPGGR